MKIFLIFLLFVGSTIGALGQISSPGLTSPDLWKPEHVPFSFQYDGKESAQFLTGWQVTRKNVAGKDSRVHRYTYTDPVTHLKVTAEVRLYPDFPNVIDWVLYFRNDGTSDTPIIENILPLHWTISSSSSDSILRHDKGSDNSAEDFTPLEEHFGPGESDHLESFGGDSSSTNTLPFFNLQNGDHGLIGAIGWTGNWKADFAHAEDGKTILMTAGMKRTHLLLHPGEEIRTPRIVLMSWTGGSWQDSQNAWRHLLLAHYTPQDNGKPITGAILFGSWGSEPIADKLAYIQWVHEHKIPVEVYAVDAGWYGASVGPESTGNWGKARGDWFPSPLYYPNGIKPLGNALKSDGLGFSLWIEPETGMPGTKIVKDHPDWFFPPLPPSEYRHWSFPPETWLANLGNPAARKGITNMVSDSITNFGMTWYRQDFNTMPERFWKRADTPDRIGMSEIGHIEGLYKMWDELLARHPGLHIDNCASGGRRIDIETMSRSFVNWRSDHGFADTMAEQAQTQALTPWVPGNMGFETYTMSSPWTKAGPYTTPKNLYLMRLGYDAGYGVTPGATGVNNNAWVAWIKQAIGEYREVQPYFYGDFYPLLPYSRSDETWTAWQWNRPEDKDGLVIVLRRPKSPFTAMELGLRHIKPDAMYKVEIRTTYDKTPVKEIKGSDLAHLQIHLLNAPDSTLVFYRQE